MHEKTHSGCIEKLINDWQDYQNSIRDLQKRNSELHTAVGRYYNKEDMMKQVILDLITNTNTTTREAKAMVKYFTRSQRRGGTKRKGSRS